MDTLILANAVLFLSTLSLRRATRLPTALRTPHHKFLSTLSLRRATPLIVKYATPFLFLSTLSLRRATVNVAKLTPQVMNFYPRSPCGERLVHFMNKRFAHEISIHALLAESDINIIVRPHFKPDFYPRSPCGERPNGCESVFVVNGISIHALLAESDLSDIMILG